MARPFGSKSKNPDPRKGKIIKQFCPKDHDKNIVGRTKDGHCIGCRQEEHPLKIGKQPVRFCPKNHDTFVTGRNGSHCKLCDNLGSLEYYYDHKEKRDAQNKQWRCENSIQVNVYQKKIYHNNIQRKLSMLLRSRLNKALQGNAKRGSAVKDLGCSVEFLKQYLESKFLPGMNWSNHGLGKDKWHIDHIRPLDSFDLTDISQFKKACHYTNLQPMWQIDNLRKSNKILVREI